MSVELQGSCPFHLNLLCWQLLIIMSTFSFSFFVINTSKTRFKPLKKKKCFFIFYFLRMSGCVYGYNGRSVKQLKSNAFSIDPPVLFFWLNDPPVLFFWLNDPQWSTSTIFLAEWSTSTMVDWYLAHVFLPWTLVWCQTVDPAKQSSS